VSSHDERPLALVLDWDGTVTERDGLHMAIERFGDLGVFDALEDELGKTLTLDEVIAAEMATITAPLEDVRDWLVERGLLSPGARVRQLDLQRAFELRAAERRQHPADARVEALHHRRVGAPRSAGDHRSWSVRGVIDPRVSRTLPGRMRSVVLQAQEKRARVRARDHLDRLVGQKIGEVAGTLDRRQVLPQVRRALR